MLEVLPFEQSTATGVLLQRAAVIGPIIMLLPTFQPFGPPMMQLNLMGILSGVLGIKRFVPCNNIYILCAIC